MQQSDIAAARGFQISPFIARMAVPKKPESPSRHKKAVALRYDQQKDVAPKVIGKGFGLLADKLLELAREHNIPIHEDADLVEILARLELNEQIPESTYFIVAEILAFVYRTNQKYPG